MSGVVWASVPSTLCSKSSWHTAYQSTPPVLLRAQKLLNSVQQEENMHFPPLYIVKARERFTSSNEGDGPFEGTGRQEI